MAKSHPAPVDSVPVRTHWARNTVTHLVLLACLVSLSIILYDEYGSRLRGGIAQGLAVMDFTRQSVPVVEAAPVPVDPKVVQYRALGEYLARRFRVSSDVTTGIVAKAHDIGGQFKIDPMLILAVIAVESRFNPIAESTMGAKGLMQIIPRFHTDKFKPLGGEKVAFDPAANIKVGAGILRDYIRRTGDIGDALQMYVGASSDESENGYSSKVMLERDRLQQMLRQLHKENRVAKPQTSVKPASEV